MLICQIQNYLHRFTWWKFQSASLSNYAGPDTMKNRYYLTFRSQGEPWPLNVTKINLIITLHYKQDSSFTETWAHKLLKIKKRGWGGVVTTVFLFQRGERTCVFAPINVCSVMHTHKKKNIIQPLTEFQSSWPLSQCETEWKAFLIEVLCCTFAHCKSHFVDLTTDKKLYANQQYLTQDLNARLSLANIRSEAFLPLHPKDLLCEAVNSEQKAV